MYHPTLCTEVIMWNKQYNLKSMEYLQLWRTTPNNSRHSCKCCIETMHAITERELSNDRNKDIQQTTLTEMSVVAQLLRYSAKITELKVYYNLLQDMKSMCICDPSFMCSGKWNFCWHSASIDINSKLICMVSWLYAIKKHLARYYPNLWPAKLN